jgi:hypothetical protein
MKNTPEEIIASAGFDNTMFKKDSETELNGFVETIISEQADLLACEIGELYDSIDTPYPVYVKRAEKCLIIAELIRRRINVILGSIPGVGREIDLTPEQTQRDKYLEEAEALILRIKSGSFDESGFSFNTEINSHFVTRTVIGAEN